MVTRIASGLVEDGAGGDQGTERSSDCSVSCYDDNDHYKNCIM